MRNLQFFAQKLFVNPNDIFILFMRQGKNSQRVRQKKDKKLNVTPI